MANTTFGLFVLTEIEKLNIIVALEDRADYLKEEIQRMEALGWLKSVAERTQDLEVVNALLKRLGAA